MNAALPTLRQLRYLVAVHEKGHFGRAAEATRVTQSTLSAGIQELESVLDARLIERTKRSVRFTDLGEEAVNRAKAILAQAEDLISLAQASGEPLTGLLRLGAIPTIGPYLLPRVLPALRGGYPELKLFLKEAQTAVLLDQVRGGELDVALIALPYDIEGLESLTLAEDKFWLVSSNDHPLASIRSVEACNVDPSELLLLEEGHCLREHALSACRFSVNTDGRTEVQGTSLFTLIELAAGGFGVTLVPDLAVQSGLIKGGDVSLTRLEGDWGRRLALVWRKISARGREYSLLGEVLRNQMKGWGAC